LDDKQQEKKQPPKEAAVKTLGKKAGDFHKLFTSPIGVKVLEALEEEFNPDILLGKTDAETNYKVGSRDVVIYIRQMIRYKENATRKRELERQSTD
jgi:hypothetical protein